MPTRQQTIDQIWDEIQERGSVSSKANLSTIIHAIADMVETEIITGTVAVDPTSHVGTITSTTTTILP